MKVLVFIDHDIICRHFIMSGAMAPLVANADVRFIFPEDDGRRVSLDPATLPLGAPFERVAVNPLRQVVWRWILFADLLKYRRGKHMASIRKTRWRALGWKAGLLLKLAGLPLFTLVFKAIVRRRFAANPATELAALFERERPDVVLHPSVLDGVFVNDLVAQCRDSGVPLVVPINSWDNPATKRTVVGHPDKLLVWGPQTRQHAIDYMRIAPDHVVAFGAAQFDVFREKPRVDRASFAAAHGIDPAKKILLFAGSNARTDEVGALTALDAQIESGALPNLAIVYRPHPWGNGGHGGERLATTKWRHVVIHEPTRAYIASLSSGDGAMTFPDYRDTHDILAVVDLVLSPLSTILIEAVLHTKPVIVYAPAEGTSDVSIKMPKVHFDEFLALPDVGLAKNIGEVVALIPKLLQPDVGARLFRQSSEFVSEFDRPWSERLVTLLRGLCDVKAQAQTKAAAE